MALYIFFKMCTSLWITEFLNYYSSSYILNRTEHWGSGLLWCCTV